MKNLKTSGNKIQNHNVEKTTENFQGNDIYVIHLTIKSENISYKFRICVDDREPDLDKTKKRLESELKESLENYKKFEVTKYKERNYLFINGTQYTGKQLM